MQMSAILERRELAEVLNGFSFRLLGPETAAREDSAFHVERSDGSTAMVLESYWSYPLDPWVVDFGPDNPRLRWLLLPLLRVPRMGRLAFAGVLNTIVRRMNIEHAFVNVGVWHGFSLLAAMAGNEDKVCIGVDNFSEFGGPRDEFLQRFLGRRSPRHRFHDQDYEDFFTAGLERPLGAYFYDGDHQYEHQYRGLMAAEPLYADDAVIIVDDANWDAPREATLKFAEDSRLDWTLVVDQPTASDSHPTLWNGILVLQAGARARPPLRIPSIDALRTTSGEASSDDASLSLIVVGDSDREPGDLGDIELVRAANSDALHGAIDASTGSYIMIAAADAELSAEELRQAVAAHQGRRVEA
jgi:Methyltransferase domain